MKTRSVFAVATCLSLLMPVASLADDVYLRASGNSGIAYVGLFYGLVNPQTSTWYAGQDIFNEVSTTWEVIADTGSSAFLMGVSTQDAYGSGAGLPYQAGVTFSDIGFGGSEVFDVVGPVQMMVAGQRQAIGDTENHSLFAPAGPANLRFAAARNLIGGGFLGMDFDIIGMSVMQGKVLRVDPRSLEFSRFLPAMDGALEDGPPAVGPGALYVPVTLQDFFTGPQTVDVGQHPMLPMSIRRNGSDAFATRTALFDTGSPASFVSESFAQAAGIDLSDPPDDTITVSGVGGNTIDRPGYRVDALTLDLGNGREGDKLWITNTAVFVIPDSQMPGGLAAVLGNGIVSPSLTEEAPVEEWFVDTRDPQNSALIIVIPEPGALALLLAGMAALRRRAGGPRVFHQAPQRRQGCRRCRG